MSKADESPVQLGQPPSAESEFYVAWGRDLVKNSFTLANDALRQLVTLSTLLLGGSVAFLDAWMIDPVFRATAIGLFLVSLCASLSGLMPAEGALNFQIPQDVKRLQEQAMHAKAVKLRIGGWSLFLGAGMAALGTLWRWILPVVP
jgi:hypothetical protein